MAKKDNEKDHLSGVDTTGHDWDGIKELNNPLPRWWLLVFYACIIWSIGYWVVYPAWPTFSGEGVRGGTKGSLGWTQYTKLDAERQEILERRAGYLERFSGASFDEIKQDEELYAFAMAGGHSAFKANCTTCHGSGGAGAIGYPNLNDDDWIWGGDMDSIYETIQYGVRIHDDSRQSMMPAFGEMLSADEIHEVASYVSEMSKEGAKDHGNGATVYAENCAVCHGEAGEGMRDMGAPNLADAIWLKSKNGSVEAIVSQVTNPKHGMMPAWIDRLDDDTIRQLTIYVHSLGGGE